MSESTTYLPPVDVRSESFADFMADYPFASEVDAIDDLPQVVCTADDEGNPFTARVLGFGSSYRDSHYNHAPGVKPAKGTRCSGCRWTDTAILKADDGHYVFVSLGKSAIEGEWQKNTVVWTRDAEDVLRKLFVPTKRHFTRQTGAFAIPPHNAAAFREAACVDTVFAELLQQYAEVFPEADAHQAGIDPLADL